MRLQKEPIFLLLKKLFFCFWKVHQSKFFCAGKQLFESIWSIIKEVQEARAFKETLTSQKFKI